MHLPNLHNISFFSGSWADQKKVSESKKTFIKDDFSKYNKMELWDKKGLARCNLYCTSEMAPLQYSNYKHTIHH
jgi:hypothetical protein